jgi:hypothetical protein
MSDTNIVYLCPDCLALAGHHSPAKIGFAGETETTCWHCHKDSGCFPFNRKESKIKGVYIFEHTVRGLPLPLIDPSTED